MSTPIFKFDPDLEKAVGPLNRQIWVFNRVTFVLVLLGVALVAHFCFSKGGWKAIYTEEFPEVVQATWALAGVVLIYVAFLGQRLSLLHQQQELRDTRTELRGQKEEFQAQNETFRNQRFDDTFFNLLTLHHELVRGISYDAGNGTLRATVSGREFFEHCSRDLLNIFESTDRLDLSHAVKVEISWDALFKRYQTNLGHYFRNFYHIIKLVENSGMDEMKKRSYTSIAGAQLSAQELTLLLYNCAVGAGRDKFNPLARKFELFDNLDCSLLLNESDLRLLEEELSGEKWPDYEPVPTLT